MLLCSLRSGHRGAVGQSLKHARPILQCTLCTISSFTPLKPDGVKLVLPRLLRELSAPGPLRLCSLGSRSPWHGTQKVLAVDYSGTGRRAHSTTIVGPLNHIANLS